MYFVKGCCNLRSFEDHIEMFCYIICFLSTKFCSGWSITFLDLCSQQDIFIFYLFARNGLLWWECRSVCLTRSGACTIGKSHTAVCINSCAPAEAAGATGACAVLIAVHLEQHKLAFVIAELMNYWGAALAVAINLKVCTVCINNWACFVRPRAKYSHAAERTRV